MTTHTLQLTWTDRLRHHLNPLHVMCRVPKQYRRGAWLKWYQLVYDAVLG